MPVFINEVTAQIPQPPVAESQSRAIEEQVVINPSEYELMQTLNIIEERRQRLEFD